MSLIPALRMTLNIAEKWSKSHKLNRFRTSLYASLWPCPSPRVAFIFGCQRSGTTLLRDFIGLDHRFRDIGEGDPPYFHQNAESYLRLVEDSVVEKLVTKQKSPWVLLKPLHDSQRGVELLDRFQGSRGIWIFRHYESVVQSHLHYYQHDPLQYLAPLMQLDRSSWMLSGLEDDAFQLVREMLDLAGSSIPDLYSVFWYARNALLFQHLRHSNLLVVSYEDLVANPHQCLQVLSRHLGTELSTKALVVPKQPVAKSVAFHPLKLECRAACEGLFKELSSASRLTCLK